MTNPWLTYVSPKLSIFPKVLVTYGDVKLCQDESSPNILQDVIVILIDVGISAIKPAPRIWWPITKKLVNFPIYIEFDKSLLYNNDIDELGNFDANISVTGDGVKTAHELLEELVAQLDFSKLKSTSIFIHSTSEQTIIKHLYLKSNSAALFVGHNFNSGTCYDTYTRLLASNSVEFVVGVGSDSSVTNVNSSSDVVPAGQVYSIKY